jgi:hypothetical protein
MKTLALAATFLAALSSLLLAQERPVPKDSARLSIAGCARGRVFTVGRDPNHESRGFELEEGMKVRLEGQKPVLQEIKTHEGSMVELTGLMKQSDTVQPGIGLAGGRVRVTPVMPAGRGGGSSMGGLPTPVIDVESWRPLNSSCPKR